MNTERGVSELAFNNLLCALHLLAVFPAAFAAELSVVQLDGQQEDVQSVMECQGKAL